MRTHKNITSALERAILCAALCMFRKIKKPQQPYRTLMYFSTIGNGVLDLCTIDVKAWKLIKVEYEILNRGKMYIIL